MLATTTCTAAATTSTACNASTFSLHTSLSLSVARDDHHGKKRKGSPTSLEEFTQDQMMMMMNNNSSSTTTTTSNNDRKPIKASPKRTRRASPLVESPKHSGVIKPCSSSSSSSTLSMVDSSSMISIQENIQMCLQELSGMEEFGVFIDQEMKQAFALLN
ncbi:hypothetical protein C9374_003498 [Naegleria lovaniensis]|uniref:Uncharacterized protein n=1 Tax=Naegleria lovaniensis TaxID=51637 RepID=A0AA88GSY2_NAELO|nr:uncharacterized protein C9374_003498 [Naegleria lovaniensis]KAG2385683.1 hypothetical protein C9374_003498 [Naegleria lovaniensis]